MTCPQQAYYLLGNTHHMSTPGHDRGNAMYWSRDEEQWPLLLPHEYCHDCVCTKLCLLLASAPPWAGTVDKNFIPAYPQARGTLEHLPLSDASPLSSITTGPSPVVQMPALQMNDLEQMPSEQREQQQQKGSQSLIMASLKVVKSLLSVNHC